MITAIEIRDRESFVGGAEFGATGAYTRLNGTAFGELDPSHPGNRGIALLDKAPRNARGRVEYRSDFVILRPTDPARGNGRILYEVNNRGRIMLFANMCAGVGGQYTEDRGGSGQRLPAAAGLFAGVVGLGSGRAESHRIVAGRAGGERRRKTDRAAHPRGVRVRHTARRIAGVPAVARSRQHGTRR